VTVAHPDYLIVARIVAAFGIKGEVKAAILTDFPDRLANRKTVFLGAEDEQPRMYTVRGVRFHQNQILLSLGGVEDRNTSETLRGLYVQIPFVDAPLPPPGTYYVYQIVGLEVFDIDGVSWGKVSSIVSTGSNDIYVVDGERGQALLPAVPDYVREVDLVQGRIVADMAAL
jgi:16S rRNA processing protein RimM